MSYCLSLCCCYNTDKFSDLVDLTDQLMLLNYPNVVSLNYSWSVHANITPCQFFAFFFKYFHNILKYSSNCFTANHNSRFHKIASKTLLVLKVKRILKIAGII